MVTVDESVSVRIFCTGNDDLYKSTATKSGDLLCRTPANALNYRHVPKCIHSCISSVVKAPGSFLGVVWVQGGGQSQQPFKVDGTGDLFVYWGFNVFNFLILDMLRIHNVILIFIIKSKCKSKQKKNINIFHLVRGR